MADTANQADIRGLEIDKVVKGFALRTYIFKSAIGSGTMSSDQKRWYQETAADLTATSPSAVANISPLSSFAYLEPTWTRNVSYFKKYGAENMISMEDMKGSDLDVMTRTILRLTRAVVKQVDSDIFNVITENQSPSNINSVTSTAAWNAGSGQNPLNDVLEAIQKIEENDYESTGLELWLSPKDKTSLLDWLIATKGASIPAFSSEKVRNGVIMNFLGCTVRVSNNVVADYAVVLNPSAAATWYSFQDTSVDLIEDKGIGTKIRVHEAGVAVLHDPKAVSLISNTQA